MYVFDLHSIPALLCICATFGLRSDGYNETAREVSQSGPSLLDTSDADFFIFGSGKANTASFWNDYRGIGFNVAGGPNNPDDYKNSRSRVIQGLEKVVELGFNAIRLWTTNSWSEMVFQEIRSRNLNVKAQAGIWIDKYNIDNFEEVIDIALGQIKEFQDLILGVSLGNEQEFKLGASQLQEILDYMRLKYPSVPVGYNTYEHTITKPDLVAVMQQMDFVGPNVYSGYWSHLEDANWRPEKGAQRLAGKDYSGFAPAVVILGESGWQSDSPLETRLVDDPDKHLEYYFRFVQVMFGPDRSNITFASGFFFALVDEGWKGKDDGWGLYYEGDFNNIGAAKHSNYFTLDEILSSDFTYAPTSLYASTSAPTVAQAATFSPTLSPVSVLVTDSPASQSPTPSPVLSVQTKSPTSSPVSSSPATDSPSASATDSPTTSPYAPTTSPGPVVSPTSSPSASPSASPTSNTLEPISSQAPSSQPSVSPSSLSSVSPTALPTTSPSNRLTTIPSSAPSASPTLATFTPTTQSPRSQTPTELAETFAPIDIPTANPAFISPTYAPITSQPSISPSTLTPATSNPVMAPTVDDISVQEPVDVTATFPESSVAQINADSDLFLSNFQTALAVSQRIPKSGIDARLTGRTVQAQVDMPSSTAAAELVELLNSSPDAIFSNTNDFDVEAYGIPESVSAVQDSQNESATEPSSSSSDTSAWVPIIIAVCAIGGILFVLLGVLLYRKYCRGPENDDFLDVKTHNSFDPALYEG